jgi:nucleotide-binding universal stress UspA family protein
MTEVLLLVPPDRQVTKAIQTALDLAAQRGAGLLAAVVIDEDASARLARRMINVGMLAEKITDQVAQTLEREHRIRGEALLREIAEHAAARAIPCRTIIASGDPAEAVRRLVVGADIVAAVVVTETRSWFERLISVGQRLRLPALDGREVILVGED